jgi:hypothetical protein
MDDRQRNEQRAYERECEQHPRGNRLSVVPMDANNLGRDNQISEQPTNKKEDHANT